MIFNTNITKLLNPPPASANFNIFFQICKMHIHPHNKAGSNFKEHFVHFLMLFLAVLLGAVAENLRENHIENNNEREYLTSLVEDLGQDTLRLNSCINSRLEKNVNAQKLISLLGNDKIENTKDVYYLSRLMTKVETFEGVDGTFNQLQYSGGFKVIRHKKIIKKINDYLFIRKNIYSLNKTEEEILIQFRIATSKVVNSSLFSKMLDVEKNKQYKYYIKPLDKDEPLFSYNKTDINNLIYWTSSENGNQTSNMNQMKILKMEAIDLINLITSANK